MIEVFPNSKARFVGNKRAYQQSSWNLEISVVRFCISRKGILNLDSGKPKNPLSNTSDFNAEILYLGWYQRRDGCIVTITRGEPSVRISGFGDASTCAKLAHE